LYVPYPALYDLNHVAYDGNGNITPLVRSASDGPAGDRIIDDLTYTY
jgi:hypothetical protein